MLGTTLPRDKGRCDWLPEAPKPCRWPRSGFSSLKAGIVGVLVLWAFLLGLLWALLMFLYPRPLM